MRPAHDTHTAKAPRTRLADHSVNGVNFPGGMTSDGSSGRTRGTAKISTMPSANAPVLIQSRPRSVSSNRRMPWWAARPIPASPAKKQAKK